MDIMNQVAEVNKILLDGEPGNISVDTYSGFTGYKPQHIIDAMNAIFGIGKWGFKELSSDLEEGLAIAQVEVWISGVEFRPTGWGQARITKGDRGDARKGAQTDAIKKALSYFSIGNRAYQGLLEGADKGKRSSTPVNPRANNAAKPEPVKSMPANNAQVTPALSEEKKEARAMQARLEKDTAALKIPRRGGGFVSFVDAVGKALDIQPQEAQVAIKRGLTLDECAEVDSVLDKYRKAKASAA